MSRKLPQGSVASVRAYTPSSATHYSYSVLYDPRESKLQGRLGLPLPIEDDTAIDTGTL